MISMEFSGKGGISTESGKLELLRQGGGIQGAAEAAVKGDTSQLVGMMQRLMNTPEGGELVERISRQARQSGLTD